MRSHADIVKAAGPQSVADGCGKSIHTVRSWVQRDSIPSEFWVWFRDKGVAGLDELAEYDTARNLEASDGSQKSAA